jgi:predicted RNA methylase
VNAVLPGVDAPVRDVSKSQWFTPPELAGRIVSWALLQWAPFVLEPSAGDGALVKPLLNHGCSVLPIDIDPANCAKLTALGTVPGCGNFLEMTPYRRFDLAVMNPPFENGATEAHILHALKFCDRVVCHCPLTTLEGIKRKAALWDKVQLHRMVIHSARPKYGPKGGATAMCTIDVTLGHTGAPTSVEWW